MNIFEKYGGYEAVKQAAVNYKNSGDRVTAAGLELQCLEYRRQHNIFEIDDYVVNEHPDTIEAVFQVESLTPKLKKPKTLRCGRWGNHPVGCNSVRHATDAEIKAGKRLPD